MKLFGKQIQLQDKRRIDERTKVEKISTFAFVLLAVSFFAIPLMWLVLAPFDSDPTFRIKWPNWGLGNFSEMAENPYAYRSLMNSAIFSAGSGLAVILVGAPASYVLSRIKFAGRDAFLYVLLLF